MNPNFAALQEAIDKTLAAVSEGRGQVGQIVESTSRELQRLESEYEQAKDACMKAIAEVAQAEMQARRARTRLAEMSRLEGPEAEAKMREAYTAAENAQTDLKLWREREANLRWRRDELARQLKTMQVTLHNAESLLMKFDHVRDYLANGLAGLSTTLELAHLQTLLGFQMLQMQEEERRFLAQVLHDGPMQLLASVAMRLEAHSHLDGDIKQEVQGQLRAVIQDLRRVAFDLRPPLIDDLGLIPALKRYVQQWTEWTQVQAKIHLSGIEVPLGAAEKMAVFRSVQEALHNVEQHAHARKVDIFVVYGLDTLLVRVRDDGVGLAVVDWSGWLQEGRIGLTMVNQRLQLLQGSLDVQRRENGGTEVIIHLPLRRSDFTRVQAEGGGMVGNAATHSRGHRG